MAKVKFENRTNEVVIVNSISLKPNDMYEFSMGERFQVFPVHSSIGNIQITVNHSRISELYISRQDLSSEITAIMLENGTIAVVRIPKDLW